MTLMPPPVWAFDDLRPYVPPRGFIHDYVRYAVQCTDAPPLYHILAASAVASAAVAPYLDLVDEHVLYPLHLFMLIVGESASRKSSAIRRMRQLAQPVFSPLSTRGSRIWPLGTSSPEGVLEDLSREPNRLIIINEWSNLHRTSGQAKYWVHAAELWNECYDADDIERTLAGGKKFLIKRPRITIIGCSIRELVLGAVQRTDWLAGKLGRYIIGCMERPEKAFMLKERAMPSEMSRLRGMLKDIVAPSMREPAILSAEASRMIDEQESDQTFRDLRRSAGAHLKPSFGRAREHALRLSGVYEASMRAPHEPVIVTPDAMYPALELVKWCLETTIKAFPLVGDPDKQSPLVKATAMVKSAGKEGIDRSALLRSTKLLSKGLNEVLGALIERGELRTAQVPGPKGPPVTRYFYIAPGGGDDDDDSDE